MTVSKLKFTLYKNIWIIFLIILLIIIILISNFFPFHILNEIFSIIFSYIKEIIKNIIYYIFYFIYMVYYLIKPFFMNIYNIIFTIINEIIVLIKYSICSILYIIYLMKKHIYFLIAAGHHGYGIIWGEAIMNIKFSYSIINNIIYYLCDGITIIFIILIKLEILLVGLFLFIITAPYYIIKYLLKIWFSLHINISLFTFLFIIIPLSIRIYYDQWKIYWIDLQQNSEIYTYEYYGYYDYYEDNDIYEYLQKVVYPFIYYKLSTYIYYYLYIPKFTWFFLPLLCNIWFNFLFIIIICLFLFLNFIVFVCYLSTYNLYYKHILLFPFTKLINKKWEI